MFRLLCAASLKREVMFVLSMHGDLCEANKFTLRICSCRTQLNPLFVSSTLEKKKKSKELDESFVRELSLCSFLTFCLAALDHFRIQFGLSLLLMILHLADLLVTLIEIVFHVLFRLLRND